MGFKYAHNRTIFHPPEFLEVRLWWGGAGGVKRRFGLCRGWGWAPSEGRGRMWDRYKVSLETGDQENKEYKLSLGQHGEQHSA